MDLRKLKTLIDLVSESNISELVSAKEENVDDSVFTIPEDYNEMKIPGLPAGK